MMSSNEDEPEEVDAVQGDVAITDWTKLGGLVRDARRQLHLTQAQAAERAGVSRSWLARIEAGHRGAELERLMRLFNALDLTLRLGPSGASSPPIDTDADPARAGASELASAVSARARARRLAWSLPPGPERPEGS